MSKFYLLLSLFLLPLFATAQLTPEPEEVKKVKLRGFDYDPRTEDVYKVNRWKTAAVGVGGMALSTWGIERLRQKDRLDAEELAALDPNDVPWFDEFGVTRDPEDRQEAAESSDVFFNTAILLPAALFVSKRMRKDFLDITLVYLETHALSANTYAWSPLGPTFNNRLRPVAFYPSVDDGTREQGNTRNGFFSGHVSTTAVGTFFTAKVLCDYHPELRGYQKALIYGVASLPPAYVGYQRVRALKHFPSDSAAGFAVGAFWGIMTPHIHKRWQRKHKSRLSMGGSYQDGAGSMGLSLTF